jgi:hypothetical protein
VECALAVVCPAAWQHASDVDDALGAVAFEDDPPIADAQAGFIAAAGEGAQITLRRVGNQGGERVQDAVADRRIEIA